MRTHISVELIILCREDHLPEVFADAGHPGEVDAVVVETQELVDHGLVRPLQDPTTCTHQKLIYDFQLVHCDKHHHLTEQRSDGVVAAVQDQQQRRNLRLPEVKQLVLLGDDLLTERRERVNRLNKDTNWMDG